VSTHLNATVYMLLLSLVNVLVQNGNEMGVQKKEYSWEGRARPASKTDKLAAICELIV
jgi:hypothetical protein